MPGPGRVPRVRPRPRRTVRHLGRALRTRAPRAAPGRGLRRRAVDRPDTYSHPVAYAILVRPTPAVNPAASVEDPNPILRAPTCEVLTFRRGDQLVDQEVLHGDVRAVAANAVDRW